MKKLFYTTGEVSALLKISIATVSRKFDKGMFTGKKNAITGERLISRESLISFMKKYNLPTKNFETESQKKILLGSNNKQIQSIINQAFNADEQFKIDTVSSGYEALIKCAQFHPDVFLLDNELPNLDCNKAIETIKSNKDIADIIVVCINKSIESCKKLSCPADDFLTKDDIENKNIKDKLSKLLGIGEPVIPEDFPYEHYRKWPRIKIQVPANVELFVSDIDELKDKGDTIVDNISLGGAYLTNINLNNKALFEPSKILLKVDQPPLENLTEECRFVRLHGNRSINAGVQFINLKERSRGQILKLMS